ncbi:MAG: TolC family protein [Bacteroidales bacterium]
MKKVFTMIFALLSAVEGLTFGQQKWSLEDCIKYSIDHNIQIKEQTVQTRIQKNALAQAKLNLLPTINGTASHSYTFGRALDQNSYQFFNQTVLQDYFYVSGSTNLFSGLQNYNNIQKSRYDVLAGEQDLQMIRDNVSMNVALAYLQILLNKELVASNENQVEISKQQIAKTQKLVDAGSVAKGNLLQIESQEAQEEVNLVTMRNALETSYLNLTQLLELTSPAGFEVLVPVISVDSNAVITGNIDEIYNLALQTRPEIKSSELRLTSSQYELKIAKGGRSPSLSMNHNIGTRYSFVKDQPGIQSFQDQLKNNKSYGLGFSLNIPVLNGWQVNKNISNSKLAVENNEYLVEGARKQLYKDIQQAYTDAVASLKKYNASLKAVTSSAEAFRYTEQKFDVGMIAPVDYNAAKTQLLNAQLDASQAKYEFIFKIKVLDFYKGLPLSLNN